MNKVDTGIVIALAVVFVVGLVPLVEVPYPATVQYQDSETYYVSEPYEVTKIYTEDVQTELEIVEHALVKDFPLFVRGKVKNTSNQTLWWSAVTIWVEYQIEDLPGRTFTQPGGLDPIPATFKPGEIRDFSAAVQEGTTSYEIMPPTITQTAGGTVIKVRPVEQQRTVTRERVETHYKKVPLFEYLLSRF